MRSTLLLAAAALFVAAPESSAQCCGAPAPTVAYSPVVSAPTPVVAASPVVQTTVINDRWYLGKYLGRLFGLDPRTTTYTTAYAPTAAAPYSAGYTPYSVGYAPAPYRAAYAPVSQVAYRPTYPVTYGAVQTVSRPVVLSPVATAPIASACGACSSCGVVEQAGYAASPGCSSCQAGSSYAVQPATGYSSPAPSGSYVEPRPSLAPTDNPPAERSIQTQRPEVDDTYDSTFDDGFGDEPTEASDAAASSSDYWGAPPLFQPPANRVTQRAHPAPVRTAVYRRPVADAGRDFASPASAKAPVRRLSADGWASASE